MDEIDVTEVCAYYFIKMIFLLGGSNFVWVLLFFGLWMCFIQRRK